MATRNPTLDALLPRGIRNLNPGNIEDGSFARSQPGYVGGDGRFARFDTVNHGIDAQAALLGGYGKKGLNTLHAIVNRWAPKGDGANDPAAYAAFVGKQLGIDPGAPIDMNDPNVRRNIALAMGKFENGGDVLSLASKVKPNAYAPIEENAGPNVPFPGSGAAPSAPLQEQTLVHGTNAQEDRYSGVGPALANIGAIVAGLDRHRNTGLVAGLANTADNLVAQQRINQQQNGWDVAGFNDDKTAALLRNKATGEIKMTPMPAGFGGEKLQYKGLDTDKNGQTYDTFVNSRGELIRKPTDMVDTSMKAQEKLDDADANFWGEYVMTNPAALTQVPRAVRSQVMSSVRKQAEEAGFGGKDLFQTLQKNATDIVDYKKRAGIIANLDTYKGEFLSAAKQATEYSKELERKFGAVPLEKLTQWAEANSGSPDAVKINNLKVALEGLSRSANRAFTTASGGNVTGEQRLTQLLNPSMPHNMIVGGIGVLTKDVLRLNQNAQWALQNQRARNGGKPLPHPEIDNEEAALKDILGGYEDKGSGKTTIRDDGASSQPKRLKYNPATGELE